MNQVSGAIHARHLRHHFYYLDVTFFKRCAGLCRDKYVAWALESTGIAQI